MSCPDENTLVAWLAGDLSAAQRDGLEQHVDGCSTCQALMTALARTFQPTPGAGSDAPEEARPEPLAPGELVGHYRVMRLEGWGGMGEVYLARDIRLGRRVALKVLGPDLVGTPGDAERLMDEARTIARFSHPNIVTIHDVGLQDGRPFLALEYLDGQTLRQRLIDGPPGMREALRLSLAVAAALEEAHRNDVLHGDLKPENVLIPVDGRPRVVDFGLARIASDATSPPAELGGTPAYMAPELWEGVPPTPASDIWALGRVMLELAAGRGPGEVEAGEAPTDLPEGLRALIDGCLSRDPGARPAAEKVRQRLELLLHDGREELRVDDGSPFRGLTAYSEAQARLFFGRDDEISTFLERLRTEPVLSVVGPSGIGKSSFVQAGVIPRLKEQGRWTVLGLRPGLRPFHTLVSHLAATSRSGDEPLQPGEIARAPHLLGLALQRIATAQRSRVLLFIDQFEELLTLVEDGQARGAFIRAVCTAADDPLDPVRVVITVREDVLGQLAHEPAARLALERVTILSAPGPRALEEILVRPVQTAGYSYDDPGLVPEMVAEVQGEAACLPLVQFAGQMLWERRDRTARLLCRADYRAIGGVAGALAQHADSVLAAMTPADQRLTRTLMTRLVTPDGLRRVLTRAEMVSGLGPDAGAALDRLTDGRLVTVRRGEGEDTELELVHEALLATWDRLRRWIDEGREELRVLADAEQAARRWEQRGRQDDELWRGAVLREAHGTLEQCSTVPPRVQRFIAAGRHRQRRRVLRRRALLIGAFAVLAAVALGFAAKERESERQRRIAEGRSAEAQRASAWAAWARGDLLQARAQLRGSFETRDSASARILWWKLSGEPMTWRRSFGDDVFSVDAAGDTLAVGCGDRAVYLVDVATGGIRRILRGHADQLESVAFAPDGKRVASASLDGSVWLWEVASGTGRPLPGDATHRSGIDRGGNILAFSPDGVQLAAGGRDGRVRLWEVPSGVSRGTIGGGGAVYAVAFGPGGKSVASGGADGQVVIWDVGRRVPRHRLVGHSGAVHALSYSPDGRLLASGSIDRTTRIWDTASGKQRQLVAGKDTVQAVRFSPDGRLLAHGGGGGHVIRLLDVEPGRHLGHLSGHTALVTSLQFLPDGRRLASASMDRTVRLWDVRRQNRAHLPTTGHGGRVYGASFSLDGRHLATASEDRTARIWDVSTGRISRTLRHPGGVLAAAYGPDGRTLATSCNDGIVRLWDASSGREVARLGHATAVLGLAFSPDGRTLATGGVDRTVRIWDLDRGKVAHRLAGHTARIFDVAYSPDGAQVASAGLDGTLRIWDARDGRQIRTLSTEPGAPGAGAFHGVVFGLDGRRVASGGADGTVRLWDLDTGGSRLVGRHAGRVYHLAFHPDGLRIGAPDATGVSRIWQLGSEQWTALEGHRGEVNFLRFSPDGTHAATTSDDGTVRLWHVDGGRPRWLTVALLPAPPRLRTHRGWVALDGASAAPRGEPAWLATARAASQDARTRLLCVGTLAGDLQVWEAADRPSSHMPVPHLDRVLATPAGCLSLADGRVRLHRRNGKVRDLARSATAIDWSGSEIVVARDGQILRLSPDGRQRATRTVGRGVTAVASAGQQLVLGFQDGNLEMVPPTVSFQQISGMPVERVLLGPMDTLIAGSAGGQLGIWQLKTGELLTRGQLHGSVTHLLLAGQWLYAASDLGDHLAWDLSALHATRCELMRTMWRQVPVVWRGGVAVSRGPPRGHSCR